MVTTLECDQYTRGHTIKVNKFRISLHQPNANSSSPMDETVYSPLSLSCGNYVWLEFAHILCFLLQTFGVYMCIFTGIFVCIFKCCKVIYFLWFLWLFYSPFLLRSMGGKGRSVRSLVHLVLVHLVSYFLHGDQLWLSELIANYCKKKVLSLGLRNVLIYGYRRTS